MFSVDAWNAQSSRLVAGAAVNCSTRAGLQHWRLSKNLISALPAVKVMVTHRVVKYRNHVWLSLTLLGLPIYVRIRYGTRTECQMTSTLDVALKIGQVEYLCVCPHFNSKENQVSAIKLRTELEHGSISCRYAFGEKKTKVKITLTQWCNLYFFSRPRSRPFCDVY